MRLLLIEDDRNLGQATAEGLREQFAVDWFTSAEEGYEALATVVYALLVLDINLPGQSGLELLKMLRLEKNQIPVLLLTARDQVQHRVEGLNTGADDYLIKPFDLDELLARCNALARRAQGQGSPIIEHGDIRYDTTSGHAEVKGKSIQLSAREKAIFDCLIRNIDRPVSRRSIEEAVYDWSGDEIESNTIEVHISSLRRKLGKNFIKTIRGIGYYIPK